MLTLLMVGSRDFTDRSVVREKLTKVLETYGNDVQVISGGARGADRISVAVARAAGLQATEFLADWDRDGKIAGFKRNERMRKFLTDRKDAGGDVMCLAFVTAPKLEDSRGTADMVGRCRRHEIHTHVVHVLGGAK